MVESVVPPGLLDPKKVLGSDALIFGNLLSWGAQTAIGRCGGLYNPDPSFRLFLRDLQ